MDGLMNALVDKVHVHEQEIPYSDMHSITWPHVFATTINT